MNINTSFKIRNYKKANWPYFTRLLANKEWVDKPEIWTKEIIESEAKKLNEDILQALNKVCPEREHQIKDKKAHWWNNDLHNMRKKVRVLYKKWKKSPPHTDEEMERYDTYKSFKKEYFRNIEKAKRNSWRTFTAECEDIYMLNKIIHKK